MSNIIEIVVPGVTQVITVESSTAPPAVVEVMIPGAQGPSALSVGPTNNLTPGTAGLWVQTGLGGGTDWTLWIEDGT